MNNCLEQWFAQYEQQVKDLEHRIWEHPELAMQEFYACEQTADFLKAQGFNPDCFSLSEASEKPNTIIASYGSGHPVIGILGEYDALPDLGQMASTKRVSKPGPGHGCGHCQIISYAVAAFSALKQVMEQENLSGTLVFMATPAEESLQGKVMMAAAGYFDQLDICFCWHPCDSALSFDYMVSAASSDVIFEFSGKAAHAAMQPWLGRSALDAAELMSVGIQYLREHITEDCKVHHSYLSAGTVPNIVPETASVRYLVRSNDANHDEMMERVFAVAEGAAKMTGTIVKHHVQSHCWGSLPNTVLNDFCYRIAQKQPNIQYSQDEYQFAKELFENATNKTAPEDLKELLPTEIVPPKSVYIAGSSDAGDVSHIVPTIQVRGLGRVKGTPGHHWSMVAVSGTSIAEKAAVQAAKIIAQCIYEVLISPDIVDQCWREFDRIKKCENIPPYRKFCKENSL